MQNYCPRKGRKLPWHVPNKVFKVLAASCQSSGQKTTTAASNSSVLQKNVQKSLGKVVSEDISLFLALLVSS